MRVLQVVHGYPPAATGGTEIYTRMLAHALAAAGHDVFVLAREDNPCRAEYGIRRAVDGAVRVSWINNTFRACRSLEDSYANPALLACAEREIAEVAPDIVHIQHLTCLSTGVPRAAARLGIPCVMTLNDYWPICHRGQLLTSRNERCDGPFDGGCAGCLPAAGLVSADIGRWSHAIRKLPGAGAVLNRAARLFERTRPDGWARGASSARLDHMRKAVEPVEVFLAPSETAARLFGRFGLPSARLRRCEQGIDVGRFQQVCRQASSGPLRIGFAGTLLPSKAPHLLLEAVERLPAGAVELHILGAGAPYHGDLSYMRRLAPLLAGPVVRRAERLEHATMPAALASIDVLVVPSVWIENAPFVIREAFAAGVPVIASNLGGMAEMVRDGVDGLLFTPGDARALALQLQRLLDDSRLLPRLRPGLRRPPSIGDDAAWLSDLYTEVVRREAGRSQASRDVVPTPRLAAVVLNHGTADQTWLAVRSLQTSRSVPASTVVVDNGSPDGSARALRETLHDVAVVETGSNLGFAGGCNAGISRALADGAEFVLLLNSDAVVHPDATRRLVEAAYRHPGAGILAPVLLARQEPDRVLSAGIRYSSRTGRMVDRAQGVSLAGWVAGDVTEVDAVSGCVMLVRAELLRRIGLFDEAYFFSFEDLDLCLRARAAGFGVLLVDDAVAYHEGGHTIGSRSARRMYFAARNHLRLAARTRERSGLGAALLGSGFIVGLNAAHAVLSPDVPLFGGLAAVARGTWHHILGRYGAA